MNKMGATLLSCFFLPVMLTLVLLPTDVQADNFKSNHPLVTQYLTRQYKGSRQIWDIAQGKDGLIYFVAGDIIQHGDKQWMTIPNKFGNVLRSIHPVSPDSILVGGASLIGMVVEEDLPGKYQFISLLPKLAETHHDFGSVWDFQKSSQGYYIRAGEALFHYQVSQDTIIPLITGQIIEQMQMLGDSLFVQSRNKGLGIWEEGEFKLLPGGNFFKHKTIKGIFSLENGSAMAVTHHSGIYILEKGQIKALDSPIHQILSKVGVVDACRLGTNELAIGTIKDGLYVINESGHIREHINKQNGLQNNTILSLATDYKNNLWLGLDQGIAYIETSSQFSILNSGQDIGTGYVSQEYKNKLYLGTNQGLFVTETNTDRENRPFGESIAPVKNTTGQVWSLNIIDGKLYSGQHSGTYLIEANRGIKVNDLEGVWEIKPLRSMPGYLIASTYRGLFLLKNTASGRLEPIKKLEIPGDSREFMEDKYGFLWRTKDHNIAVKFRIDPQSHQAVDITTYPITYNNQTPGRIKVLGSRQKPLFATDLGVFEFNQLRSSFFKNRFFKQLFPNNINFNQIYEDSYGRVWYSSREEIGYYTTQLGQATRTYVPFEKIKQDFTHSFGYIQVVSKEDILLPYVEGFIHYNGGSTKKEIGSEQFRSYIVDVSTNQDPEKWEQQPEGSRIPVYRHTDNVYQFSFSSNSFENTSDVSYSYLLQGFNQQWSNFKNNNKINFTNLREGKYTLKVKAKDVYGRISEPTQFTFVILPPWYRSIPAFIGYGVLMLALVYLLYHVRKRQLIKERARMEALKLEELKQREEQFEKERTSSWQRIINLENEKLQQELKYKAKELSNSTLNLLHKNEILQNINKELHQISYDQKNQEVDARLKKLIKTISKELESSEDWEVFDSNLNAVHEEFVCRLKSFYSNLTPNDIRLCIFLRMNKSTKEIATLMNLSVRGVESSRYRLRKKMNLSRDDSLTDTIMNV